MTFKQHLQTLATKIGYLFVRWGKETSVSLSTSISLSPSVNMSGSVSEFVFNDSPSPSYSNSGSPSPSPSEEITEDYKYRCTRCGNDFVIQHYVDKEGALCTPCFNGIVKVKSYKGYKEYLNK